MPVSRSNLSLGNGLAANVSVDMVNKLFMYDADVTPLVAFTAALKNTRIVDQPKFNHLYTDQISLQTRVNNGAGYSDSATSIVVDDGTIFNTGDIVMNVATSEHFQVTAVSTNTLTIVRAVGSTAAAAMTDNDYLVNLGSSFAEGALSPEPLMLLETEDFNYTQIFKQAVGVTGTAAASKFYVGAEYPKRKAQALRDLKRKMEYAGLFGQRFGTNLTGNQPQRTTRGLDSSIVTNRFPIGGTMTESYFNNTILEDAFRYGSKKKAMYCSANMMKCFTDWGLDKLQTSTSDNLLGIQVKEYQSSFGTLMLIYHKMLEDAFSGYSFIVDPDNIFRASLPGRELQFQDDIHAPDYDGKKGQWIAEIGWDIRLEKSHAVLTGLTGPG